MKFARLAWLGCTVPAIFLFAACRTAGERGASAPADFVGNEVFERKALVPVVADLLDDFVRVGFGKPPIDDAAYLLEEHYRSLGFAFARVDYSLVAGGTRARFEIEEGPRVRLGTYSLDGVEVLDRGTVRERIDGSLAQGEGYYSAARVDSAAADVRQFYRSRGFQDVVVRVEGPAFDGDRTTATVRFLVQEGPRLWLSSVAWSGSTVLSEAELAARVAPSIGSAYTPRLREQIRRDVVAALQERGRPDARLDLDAVERGPAGAIRISFQVDPGPEVHLGNVRIVGNERTDAEVVKERLALVPGSLYRVTDVDAALRRLYSMGLFLEVRVRTEPEHGARRDLVVELVERASLELYLEPGYGSYELARVRAGLLDRNAWGSGKTARVEGGVSIKSLELELGLTDPRFLGRDDVLDSSLKLERREEPSFEFQEVGLSVGVTRRWTGELSSRLAYGLQRSDLLISDVALPLGSPREDFALSSIKLVTTFDSRDSFLEPRTGFRARLSAEIAAEAIGSDVDFVRGVLSHTHYHSLGESTVIAARGRAGVVAPFGPTDLIPLQERFFLGGESTIRSFRESELGPRDADGDPVGGEATSLVSLEVRRRLFGRFEGALFVESGNVLLDRSEFFGFDGYRHAVGVGLRYVLPVGPLRLDLGINPSPEDGEDRAVLHLSVGRPY
jgi:outer membrane protein assembly complex protein YaeT